MLPNNYLVIMDTYGKISSHQIVFLICSLKGTILIIVGTSSDVTSLAFFYRPLFCPRKALSLPFD